MVLEINLKFFKKSLVKRMLDPVVLKVSELECLIKIYYSMFFRIKVSDAINYMNLSRDSFSLWCEAVGLKSHKFEHSNRRYFVDGEFYAKADSAEIKRLKEIHGDKWMDYYTHAEKVLPFLDKDKKAKSSKSPKEVYKPQSKKVSNFINELKK